MTLDARRAPSRQVRRRTRGPSNPGAVRGSQPWLGTFTLCILGNAGWTTLAAESIEAQWPGACFHALAV
eukprot:4511586-Prymnesium_polylepis.1